MKALIQRVSRASVTAEGRCTGRIGKGLLVLLGVAPEDTSGDVDMLLNKILHLRIFEDDRGKMNLSLEQVSGGLLVVSQFTLLADTSRGNRPSFTAAASPGPAADLYRLFLEKASARGTIPVASGVFGAHMDVELVNDGPVTLMLESRKR
ncbi:MAG TPA: D-aminoacyl-tRNA deacylase [Candidatus Mcinerneyibacteriales bacterium]|nr:D-aminoacyl-tRNA deacylase [Candidatus Mcinerneyibacteriales bacterium]